jgi:hypothetical protein
VSEGRTDHRLRRAVEHEGTVDLSSQEQAEFDPVSEASLKSSGLRSPAWTGDDRGEEMINGMASASEDLRLVSYLDSVARRYPPVIVWAVIGMNVLAFLYVSSVVAAREARSF